MTVKLDKKTRDQLIELNKVNKICLEGTILKIIDPDGDPEFEAYIKEAIDKDKEIRCKRLDVTKQVQIQNNDLVKWKKENERVNEELKIALTEAEESNEAMLLAKQQAEDALKETEKARLEAVAAKHEAEQSKNSAVNDLEILQKKSQFEMIGDIVNVSLKIIIGVGVVVTIVYLITLFAGLKTDVISSAWVNVMSILLTNAFSIIGTLMGVKTMSEKK